VRVIATGLSFAILLDAFVIRTLVVPALVALTGRWNWWMPAGLSRALRVGPSQPGTRGVVLRALTGALRHACEVHAHRLGGRRRIRSCAPTPTARAA
jgi:hypothetical protein